MQCPSCAFENIPGQAACGRCGTRLDLRTADIDVTPPRARRGARALRAAVPHRQLYRIRDAASDAARRTVDSIEQRSRVPVPGTGLAFRLLVPGWAQIHQGRAVRGRLFLGIYLALGLVGMLGWGTFPGSAAVGLMFSTHVSAALDAVLWEGRVRFPAMAATTALVALILCLLIYAPAGYTLAHVAAVRRFNEDDGLFRRHDLLIVNEWAFALREPRPGQVVLFRPIRPAMINRGPGLTGRDYRRENEVVDRVLAVAGDSVTWDRPTDTLTVNGRPTALRPLRPERLPTRLDIQVPAGCFLILPTSMEGAQDWATAGCVPRGNIEAGAYFRLPLARLWWLR